MSIIETVTYRLAPGVDEADFLDADRGVQEQLMLHHPGLLRRTTARGESGDWISIVIWTSLDAADASAAQRTTDPALVAFDRLLDASSVRVARYSPLD